MARDPLAVLWRLRDAAVTEASRDLAVARTREAQAHGQLAEHDRLLRHEQSMTCGEDVAAFVVWRTFASQTRDRLQAELQAEEARVRRLQQVLLSRRTEAEAVAKAMERQRAEAGRIAAGKEQAHMDEAASRTGRFGAGQN